MFVERFVRFVPKSGLKKALSHFNNGDYRRACKEFESHRSRAALDGKGQDQELMRMYMVEAYIGHAKQLTLNGKHAEAASALEKAVALQPRYADVRYSLGSTYVSMGKVAEARECFAEALEINPGYLRARIMLAKSYHDTGENEKALEALEASLSTAPAFLLDQVKDLIRLIRFGSSGEERTILFHRLLEEKPTSSQVSKQIALEAIQNGEYDAAANELKKALGLSPNYPDLHNLLGIAYANKGMTDDAVIEFETALKIHPEYLKARLNLALALYEKGQRDDSMRNLEMVLELDPENELAMNLLRELQPVNK